MEVELKMLIAESDIATLRQHPLLGQFATAAPRDLQMSDTYFDTPEWHFKRARAGMRVRRIGDVCVQTMKAGSSASGGLHRRHEWESPGWGRRPICQRCAISSSGAANGACCCACQALTTLWLRSLRSTSSEPSGPFAPRAATKSNA